MQRMSGKEMLFETLISEQVDIIFGPPGAEQIGFYKAIPEKYRNEISYVTSRHEQGAAHMADGYARASGRPGIVLCPPGNSAVSTITGIATAHMDSSPIVVLVADFGTTYTAEDPFGETDHIGITLSCTKHNYLVTDTGDLPRILKEAVHVATTGRPSPVLVDMPGYVLEGEAEFVLPEAVDIRGYKPTVRGHSGQVKRAMDMILKSERPVIFGGGGLIWSGATEELKEFARTLRIPVISTLMGLGAYPANDPLFVNMVGMHGSYAANMAVYHSDLVISIGARFDDRATGGNFDEFAPKAKIIHIDIDPSTIEKNIRADCPIVGDAKEILRQLNERIPENIEVDRAPWFDTISEWDREHPLSYEDDLDKIKTTRVIDLLSEITGGSAVVVSDVGQHQMWVAQFYKFNRPRTHITSGGLGTMGFGFPAAMGAKFARPDDIVICVTGDGGFQMNMQELAAAVQNNVDVKIVLINNQHHGMVRQWQTMFFDSNYSGSHFQVLPDFVKLAESFGAKGIKITEPDKLEASLKEGLYTEGVVLMEIVVDYEEMVYPMLEPGGTMDEMILDSSDWT